MQPIVPPIYLNRSANRCKFQLVAVFALLAGWLLTIPANGQDWPQINGPNRNGVAVGETLLKEFPDELTPVWEHPVGQGFSGPAVSKGRVIVFHRPGKELVCESLNAADGKLVWNKSLPAKSNSAGPDGDTGPKAVPLIHDGRIYLLGSGGNFFCLSEKDGKVLWQVDVQEKYKAPSGYFGFGSSPIVIDGKLLLNVGGKSAAVVAFDLKSGREIWKSFDDRASYSSPIAMKVNGKTIAIVVTRMHMIGMQPSDGKVLFKTKFGVPGPSVNGAMPVVIGSNIFINSAYQVGARWIKVDKSGEITTLWRDDYTFASQYSTPIVFNGNLYGTAGREDMRNGSFRCIDPAEPDIKWFEKNVPVGHCLLVGDKILFLDFQGGFHVIRPNPKKFDEIYAGKLFTQGARSLPAISNGFLFTRSNAAPKLGSLVCLKVGEQNAGKQDN